MKTTFQELLKTRPEYEIHDLLRNEELVPFDKRTGSLISFSPKLAKLERLAAMLRGSLIHDPLTWNDLKKPLNRSEATFLREYLADAIFQVADETARNETGGQLLSFAPGKQKAAPVTALRRHEYIGTRAKELKAVNPHWEHKEIAAALANDEEVKRRYGNLAEKTIRTDLKRFGGIGKPGRPKAKE